MICKARFKVSSIIVFEYLNWIKYFAIIGNQCHKVGGEAEKVTKKLSRIFLMCQSCSEKTHFRFASGYSVSASHRSSFEREKRSEYPTLRTLAVRRFPVLLPEIVSQIFNYYNYKMATLWLNIYTTSQHVRMPQTQVSGLIRMLACRHWSELLFYDQLSIFFVFWNFLCTNQ